MKINWSTLAEELEAINIYFTGDGYRAIFHILGEEFFEQAVEHTLSLEEGWMLSEGVLRILAPLGMKHCYKIYKTSSDLETRRRATWLMKYIGDRSVLPHLPEFLADPDEGIQGNVIEIIDQMLFKRKIDDEDIMPLLESVLDHPNERVRTFAIGTVHEETIQGMTDFIQEFQESLSNELYHWQKRLKFETIQSFDLCCLPWFGQIELNFLTTQEDFDLGKAYEEDYYYVWRLKTLPHKGDALAKVGHWMGEEYKKSGRSLKSINFFLEAAVTVLNSSSVQKMLNHYKLSDDFKITVFNTYTAYPWKNIYVPSEMSKS